MEETVKQTFTLPDEVIVVKYISRKKGMAANVADNHVIAGGLMSKSKIRYAAPLQKNGAIANILNKEEKEFLEGATGLNLSVYDKFFKEFYVSLYKDDASNKFNLSDPLDYIAYKILSVCPEVAPDWEARNLNAEFRFAITREGEVQDEKKKALDVKKEAFKAYGKIEDDKEKLLSVLKLLTNKAIANTSKIKWVQGQIEVIIDEKPESFLAIVKDPSFETKALINKGVEAKVIIKEGNQYVTNDGLQLCEPGGLATFANAVKYLDDDKNQELRLLIEARIDKA
ncbi:MAG: hypothetical protein ACSLE0_23360 [Chitinophagaceae bacterium]